MPKGVYQRGPGKKNKAPGNNSYSAKRLERGNFNKRPNHGDVIQTPARRDPPTQVTRTLSPGFIFMLHVLLGWTIRRMAQ